MSECQTLTEAKKSECEYHYCATHLCDHNAGITFTIEHPERDLKLWFCKCCDTEIRGQILSLDKFMKKSGEQY